MWYEIVSTTLASTGGAGLPWEKTTDVIVQSVQYCAIGWCVGSAAWTAFQAYRNEGLEHIQGKLVSLGVGGGVALGARPTVSLLAAAAGAASLHPTVWTPELADILGEVVGMGLYAVWLGSLFIMALHGLGHAYVGLERWWHIGRKEVRHG